MRRATLDLLRCQRCGAGSLVPDADVAERAMSFGPARCVGCGARFPVHDGLVDLVSEPAQRTTRLQQAMETPWLARSWERYLRPAVDTLLTRGRFDHHSEYTVLRNLVGAPSGAVVDLGCGTGQIIRRLSRDVPGLQAVGVDVSRAMLEEAISQVREHAEAVDFLRAQVPPLPFNDASLGGVLAVGLLHLLPELDGLLAEVARALKPRGRFVATTFEPGALTRPLHESAGLYPRDEDSLRAAAAQAGLVHFERVRVAPFLIWKAERP